MSHVADVLLLTFFDDGIDDVQEWLKANKWPQLVEIGRHAGGNKHMQCKVWAAAINYFDIDAFADAVRDAKWKWPNAVQLFVKDEHDARFILRAGAVRIGEHGAHDGA